MGIPSVSIVFAARTEEEAQATIRQLRKQAYDGEVEYCYSTQGTIPEALNIALDKAKNDVIVFTETDVVPVNDVWLFDLIKSLNKGSMVFSREVNHTHFNWAGTAIYKRDLQNQRLNESYPIAEDTEYFEALKLLGITMERSNAVVLHLKEHETPKALERAFQYGYLHAQLMHIYKYYPLEQYVARLEMQKHIAEQTLNGIKKYLDEQES